MGRTPTKTAAVSGESQDRISDLVDHILYIILYFLPTKTAARTCVLSKRWATVFTSSPFLYFNTIDPEFVPAHPRAGVSRRSLRRLRVARFTESVDTVLDRRPPNAGIIAFELVWLHGFNMNKACAWVERVVTQHHAQTVDVVISPKLGDTLAFSDTMFSSPMLKILRVSTGGGDAYVLQIPGAVSLPKIRVLHLPGFFAPVSFLDDLISGCPLLETLVITLNAHQPAHVLVTAPNLRQLTLWISGNSGSVRSKIRITAPKLRYLVCCFAGLHLEDFAISSREILERLVIRRSFDVDAGNRVQLLRIINRLPNAKALCLNDRIIQSFATVPDLSKQISSPFSHLQCLEIETPLHGITVPVILVLLKSYKILEKLVITSLKEQDDLVLEWVPQELNYDFYLHHLKEIEIRDFIGAKDEMDLLNILLNKATTLKAVNLVFVPGVLDNETQRKLYTMKLAFPSASFRIPPLFL